MAERERFENVLLKAVRMTTVSRECIKVTMWFKKVESRVIQLKQSINNVCFHDIKSCFTVFLKTIVIYH